MAKSKVAICPYCGETQPAEERCRACGGLFEPLSRQATHNEMGPWFIRNEMRPFQPGCSYETLVKLIERGQVTKHSILKGPTTKQFWTIAKRVPGVSHLLGYCHNCDASVDVGDHGCHACGVPFGAYLDRNYLGLPEIRPLPWEAGGDDESSRSSSVPTIDFRRAAEPLGISSFASDAELRAGGVEPMPLSAAPAPFGGQLSTQSGGAATMQAQASPISHSEGVSGANGGPVSPVDALPAVIAARAAQRRVEQQQRTIRSMWVALSILGAVAVIAVLIALTRESAPSPAVPQGARDTPGQATVQENGGPARTGGQAAPPGFDVEAELQKADERIAFGENQEHPLDERIRAYEDALQILKTVQEKAPSDQQPEDLAQSIADIEREIDDLKMRQFFP